MSVTWENRKVILPVRVQNGRVDYMGGLPLPKMTHGTLGDLVVPASALHGWQFADLLLRVEEVELSLLLLCGITALTAFFTVVLAR